MVDDATGEGVGAADPGDVADLAGFIETLRRLRIAVGNPSYRVLAARVGPRLRPPRDVTHSTISDVFQPKRRRLDLELVVAIVRALGLDEPAVARWRAALVAVHAGAAAGGSAAVFRQLPADLATFTGRTADLERLLLAACAPPGGSTPAVAVSAIEGMAGVGKTQLALHAAHELVRAGRFAGLQLYVNLRGFDPDHAPTTPVAVLSEFLRALGVPSAQIPPGLDARAAMFRDRMHGCDALILLDNAASKEQVRDLIPASPTCLVLVTSRRSLAGLEGASLHQLDVFSRTEAIDLLARIGGADRVHADPEAALEVVRSCGFLPLALSLAASRLRARPTWSLADLADRLRTDPLAAAGGAASSAVRRVFDLSFQGLPEEAQRFFRLLGLLPGHDVTAAAAAALTALPPADARRLLETLQDESLLQEKTTGRYELHDLLRRYAADLAADLDPSPRRAAVHRLLCWYLQAAVSAAALLYPSGRRVPLMPGEESASALVFQDPRQAMDWCHAERGNVASVVSLAASSGLHGIAWRLPMAFSDFLCMTEDWTALEAMNRIGLASARHLDDEIGVAWALNNLGLAARRLGKLDESMNQFTAALNLQRRAGDTDGEIRALRNIAALHAIRGNADGAVELGNQLLKLNQHQGDKAGEGLTLNNLAITCFQMGRHEQAMSYFRQAIEICLKISDRYLASIFYRNLGTAHLDLACYAEAVDAFRNAMRISRELGDGRAQADCLRHLARIAGAQGASAQARAHLTQALAILDELGSSEADDVRRQLAQPAIVFEPTKVK